MKSFPPTHIDYEYVSYELTLLAKLLLSKVNILEY